MSSPQRANVFAKIIARYDIFLLEEIRDSTGTAISQLLNLTNQIRPSYNYTISPRLGRSSYKEQYAFFYRLDRVRLVATWQDDDPLDVYEREPYCARFRPIGSGVSWDVVVVGIHTHPDSTSSDLTVKEIGGLLGVKHRLQSVWPDVHDIVFMGDFNADCHYVSESHLKNLPIYNQTQFHWLIGFGEDTTTKTTTDCAYDRIVVTGPHITNAVVNGSAKVYHFEKDYHLSYDTMLHVSDHYPVEVTLH